MKIILPLLVLTLAYCAPTFAQDEVYEVDELSNYRSISIGIGPRSINTEPGIISTYYIDNSPSQDDISTVTTIEDSYSRIGLQLGYKFGNYNGLSHSILVDLSFGEHESGLLTYSLGYSFTKMVKESPLVLRPSMQVGFGNAGFDVGELPNDTGYIQIGETIYTDSKLDVSLKSQYFIFGPQFDIYYDIGDRFDIFLNLAYDIASDNSRPSIEFVSAGDESSSIDIEPGISNPSITYNESEITSLPYSGSGFRLTLGASYVWSWYK